MTTFYPLEDRVLIKRDENAERVGTIFIPEHIREKNPPQIGTIIAIGCGKTVNGMFIQPTVKVRDRIIFGKYSGTDIKLNNEKLTILREGDILGIIFEDESPKPSS